MFKFYRNILAAGIVSLGLVACGDDVTVSDPPTPPPPGVTSVSVVPGTQTLAVGQSVIFAASVIADAGVSTAVTWTSSAPTIATVDATGKVTGVAAGTTTIIATSTADAGKKGVSAVTVSGTTSGGPVQISIQSITTGALNVPVALSNVAGQIEVNMNFNSNGAPVDSINVFIGNKRAAKAIYAASPAAGLISQSINTAAFTTVATSPTATVAYLNGQTGITAVAYPTGAAAPTATQATQVVLNNIDGWTGTITKPTATANSAGGITYWGGPTATGITSAQIWAVQYNAGRNGIETVTWRVGGCATTTAGGVVGVPIVGGITRTFGYTAAPQNAQTACTAYENNGGQRDNIVVTAAIDGIDNGYPLSPLIANTIQFGATPDSLRLDYLAPTVSTPTVARTAPAVTGWVNGAFAFASTITDAGVGPKANSTTTMTVTGCGLTAAAMATKTGADIPECASNFIGGNSAAAIGANGTTGLPVAVYTAGTAPYRVTSSGNDLLNNVGTAPATVTFGVDKTNPSIRWGTLSAAPALPVAVAADTVFFAAGVKPAAGVDEFRVEYLDDRAGFYNAGVPLAGVSAQTQMRSTAGHFNNAGFCSVGGSVAAPIGAAFVTNPGCALVAITALGPLRLDGWQAGERMNVPAPEAYYGYKSAVVDAAGNASTTLFRKALVNVVSPFSTGLGIPATLTNAAFGIGVTAADSAEVAKISQQWEYPNMISGGSTDSVRYSQVTVGTIFDDVITSPFSGNVAPPTGAPYARHIESVNAGVFPASNIRAAGTTGTVKPTTTLAWSFNWGSTRVGGPAPARSSLIVIPALNVQDGQDLATWNAANPTIAITHWRIIATVATTDQFFSTTPLRAQAVSPTNAPNPPFSRVDFYRRVIAAGVDHWSYLGSVTVPVGSDQGTYRSWVYALPNASFVADWMGVAQVAVAAADQIMAVGVNANGDAVATVNTTMTP